MYRDQKLPKKLLNDVKWGFDCTRAGYPGVYRLTNSFFESQKFENSFCFGLFNKKRKRMRIKVNIYFK